jgi:uncharacterized membrane protein
MDMSKLTNGDKIIGVSGVLLFIFSFFKWFGYDIGPLSVSQSAWSFFLCWISVLLGVVLVAYVAMKAGGVKLPDLGAVTWSQIVLGVASLIFLLILIKLIAGPSAHGVDLGSVGISKSRKIGVFLGLIASAGLVAGAFLNAKESGELPGALGGSKGGGATPPSP